MTASQQNVINVVSTFTAALLKDTGYYAEINSNMVDSLLWGKGKGCDFFFNACRSS